MSAVAEERSEGGTTSETFAASRKRDQAAWGWCLMSAKYQKNMENWTDPFCLLLTLRQIHAANQGNEFTAVHQSQ